MGVKVISASINEKGTTTGGKAGNQGNELKRRDFYVHSKGWYYLRPKSSAKGKLIAQAAEAAYLNKNIGYCQDHRLTAYNEAAKHGFDPSKVATPVEIDCSELVRLCCAYAGIFVLDFNTASEKQTLIASGEFDDINPTSQDYLGQGDIMVTKTKGHTEIVVSNGSKYVPAIEKEVSAIETFKKYCKNEQYSILDEKFTLQGVQALQRVLNLLGYNCGEADGQFGPKTKEALIAFQNDNGLHGCGVFGEQEYNFILSLPNPEDVSLHIYGGNCWLRKGPGTDYDGILVLTSGEAVTLINKVNDLWLCVSVPSKNKTGYVSTKYVR